MHWELLVALLAAIPVVLFPVALIWYLNVGGFFTTFKEIAERHISGEKHDGVLARNK